MNAPALTYTQPRVRALTTLVNRFSLRPGWRLRVQFSGDAPALALDAEVQDSDDPGRTIRLARLFVFPWEFCEYDYAKEDHVVQWVRNCVMEMERHETNEWLRFDGRRLVDPHEGGV